MATAKGAVRTITTKGALKPFMSTGCSGAACQLLNRAFGTALEVEERAAAYLAGGILTNGYQCGQVWGAALAAGAEAYRRLGPGPEAEAAAIEAARRVVDRFREENGAVDCYDLTATDWLSRWQLIRYMMRGQPVGCYRMLKAYLPAAHEEIHAALTEDRAAAPASCAAELARGLGMSEHQAVMAAGLAGGIGLSGGGCGALGVAVWRAGMRELEAGDGRVDFASPRVREVIDVFLAATGYEFECAEITGRRFRDAADHGAWVEGGGCRELLEVLHDA